MTIRWYAPAQLLGLVCDVSHLGDGSTWEVSRRCGEVFSGLLLVLALALLLSAFLLRLLCAKPWSRYAVHGCAAVLLLYAVLLAVGIGPYVELYPRGSGFLDFSAIEHILQGMLCMIFALLTAFFGWLGTKLNSKRRTPA